MITIPFDQLQAGMFIFIRIGGILFALPIIGESPTPIRVRALLALALTVGLQGVILPGWSVPFVGDPITFAVLVLRELLVGLLIGFTARLTHQALVLAASVVGFQMGFGTANLLMPDSDMQMNAFTAFHRAILFMMFFALNLHHIFFRAIVDSFTLIPAGTAAMNGDLASALIRATASVFTLGVQLAAPILVALLFTMAALGLIARTVPQMNVFTMSFPLSFFVGLLIYMATFPFMATWTEDRFADSYVTITGMLRLLGRGT